MADRTGTFYALETAVHGYGAQLLVGDGGSPETFEAIAGVKKITPGEMSTEDMDRTHLRSPDAHREHQAGLRDSGPFTVEGFLLKGEESQNNTGGGSGSFTSGGLVALWRGRATHNFLIRLNDGSPYSEWPFRGYVSQFQLSEIGEDELIKFTAGFQPTEDFSEDLP